MMHDVVLEGVEVSNLTFTSEYANVLACASYVLVASDTRALPYIKAVNDMHRLKVF